MNLDHIFRNSDHWLVWEQGAFSTALQKPEERRSNREMLGQFYQACIERAVAMGLEKSEGSRRVRALWSQKIGPPALHNTLPLIIREDGFLCRYALGLPVKVGEARLIWEHLNDPCEGFSLSPIYPRWNSEHIHFNNVHATPPGFLPKFSISHRLRKDRHLLALVEEDLRHLSSIQDHSRRKWLTLAVLSHAAAYRELDEKVLNIPSFFEENRLMTYLCKHHLIAEGVKTVSLIPQEEGAPPIYLCQGTELWPSQPSWLGSILANFAIHGSATQAYAHSWRRIHKQLRELKVGESRPIVSGHSMGGAMAIQIGLYSHELIDMAYAFNPPLLEHRAYEFYGWMDSALQKKIRVAANLDDFAFWRIGSRVIGKTTLFLGKKRWRYQPIGLWDCIFLVPAFVKFLLNMKRAFPAHQKVTALSESWVEFELTQEEIDKEHQDRKTRFDYLHFFPKLYDPTRILLRFVRRLFGWSLRSEFLRNEIEIIALHERDLIDTLTDENKGEIERQLLALARQKEALRKELFKS